MRMTMKLSAFVWLISVLLATSTTVLADQSVTVALALQPAHALPGVPVSFRITVKNGGSEAVEIPNHVLLRVFPHAADPFIAVFGFNGEHRFSPAQLSDDATPFRLAAGSEHTFVIAVRDIKDVTWFVDPRLSRVGSYRVQTLLASAVPEEELFHIPAIQAQSLLSDPLVSSEALFTIDKPTGVDAAVYEKLLAVSHAPPDGWSVAYAMYGIEDVARFVVERYPQSAYAPYLAPYDISLSDQERIDATRRILRLHPDAPNRDFLRLSVARQEAGLAGDALALVQPNLALAIRRVQEAKSEYEALERETSDRTIRDTARLERQKLPTVAELEERLRESQQQ